jgi:uncharacterized small protein (DUF1192 family)
LLSNLSETIDTLTEQKDFKDEQEDKRKAAAREADLVADLSYLNEQIAQLRAEVERLKEK